MHWGISKNAALLQNKMVTFWTFITECGSTHPLFPDLFMRGGESTYSVIYLVCYWILRLTNGNRGKKLSNIELDCQLFAF